MYINDFCRIQQHLCSINKVKENQFGANRQRADYNFLLTLLIHQVITGLLSGAAANDADGLSSAMLQERLTEIFRV